MRNIKYLEEYRIPLMGMMGDEYNGCFKIQLKETGIYFTIVCSNGLNWDHVSISTETRCPRWEEMQKIKEMFFEDDETVMQLHPSKDNYVNVHEYCLHLWKPQHGSIPVPPQFMV